MIKWFLLGIGVLLVVACEQKINAPRWTVAYENDKEGNLVNGSKAALIEAIRNGHDIKIGWRAKRGERTIEHLSEPIWLAVLNSKEVLARLDPQVGGSVVDWKNLTATYSDNNSLSVEWRVVLTTKGSFDAVWYDTKADSLVRRVPQQHEILVYTKMRNWQVLKSY